MRLPYPAIWSHVRLEFTQKHKRLTTWRFTSFKRALRNGRPQICSPLFFLLPVWFSWVSINCWTILYSLNIWLLNLFFLNCLFGVLMKVYLTRKFKQRQNKRLIEILHLRSEHRKSISPIRKIESSNDHWGIELQYCPSKIENYVTDIILQLKAWEFYSLEYLFKYNVSPPGKNT